MESITSEVAANPSGVLPYKVVFRRDDAVLSEWPVSSIAEGESQIAEALRAIRAAVRSGASADLGPVPTKPTRPRRQPGAR